VAASGFLWLVALPSFLMTRKEPNQFQPASPSRGIRAKSSSESPSAQSKRLSGEHSEPLDITGPTVYYQGNEIPVAGPRRIRLSPETKKRYALLYALMVLLEVVFAYLIYQSWERLTPGEELPWAILLLLALAGLVGLGGWQMPRRLRRHRDLLTNGEMALGRVIEQHVRQSGNRSEHRIGYRFKNKAGRVFSGEDTDRTENFYEGNVIPVVYERGDPGNHVALCSTDYEVLAASD
jgi:hypothetical protein